jgi:nucleoside phosphorylase
MSKSRSSHTLREETRPPENGVLFQFLNVEIQQLYGVDSRKFKLRELDLLLRYALLVGCGRVMIPAAGLFENDLATSLLRLTRPLAGTAALSYISPTPDLHTYEEKKRREYRDQPNLFSRYLSSDVNGKPSLATTVPRQIAFTPRVLCSAAEEIGKVWIDYVGRENISGPMAVSVACRQGETTDRALARLYSVPDLLEERAFVPANVCAALGVHVALQERMKLGMLLSRGFLISFLREYDTAIVVDTPYGQFDAGLSHIASQWRRRCTSLIRMRHRLDRLGLRTPLESWLSVDALWRIASGAPWAACWRFLAGSDSQGSLQEAYVLNRMRKQFSGSMLALSEQNAIVEVCEERLLELAGVARTHSIEFGHQSERLAFGQPATGCGTNVKAGTIEERDIVTVNSHMTTDPVDVGVICIRQDELTAVRTVLGNASNTSVNGRIYARGELALPEGVLNYAVAGTSRQGNVAAQATAGNLIRDLHPKLLVVVGIAGGVPADEFSLGDVVVSKEIADFQVEAVVNMTDSEYHIRSEPLHHRIQGFVDGLANLLADDSPWPASVGVGVPPEPPNFAKAGVLKGNASWKKRVIQTVSDRFDPANADTYRPRVVPGIIAASDRLMKSAERLQVVLKAARSLVAIEMESVGIAQAARDNDTPFMSIRGISDIVGLKRDPAWTQYACGTAATACRWVMGKWWSHCRER